jgi:hypothetical protein
MAAAFEAADPQALGPADPPKACLNRRAWAARGLIPDIQKGPYPGARCDPSWRAGNGREEDLAERR